MRQDVDGSSRAPYLEVVVGLDSLLETWIRKSRESGFHNYSQQSFAHLSSFLLLLSSSIASLHLFLLQFIVIIDAPLIGSSRVHHCLNIVN